MEELPREYLNKTCDVSTKESKILNKRLTESNDAKW